MLLEDRKIREQQWEAEQQRQREAADGERAQLREQMEMLRQLVEGTTRRAYESRPQTRTSSDGEPKLMKLSDQDDIEAYLTTFERVMRAYEVSEERWAVKLAPQLTGKAQQAYAAMGAEDAGEYTALKEAILRRYDISEETYRQRFRALTKKHDEAVSEMVVHLHDLLQKWTKSCTSVEDIRDLMVQEQLLDSLPVEVKIWVREHKPKTSTEAAELADNYLRARRQEKNTRGGEDPSKERKPWHRQREGNDENRVKGKAQSQDGAKEKGACHGKIYPNPRKIFCCQISSHRKIIFCQNLS